MNTISPSGNNSLRLLVVSDFLPDTATDDGWRLINMLQGTVELGHAVTIIARDEPSGT
jgi:hypothetical protein